LPLGATDVNRVVKTALALQCRVSLHKKNTKRISVPQNMLKLRRFCQISVNYFTVAEQMRKYFTVFAEGGCVGKTYTVTTPVRCFQ